MYLELDDWHVGYEQIVNDCRKPSDESESGASVLILAHADVDALCSARILSYMLRADGVSYELRPCRSFQNFKEICSVVARDSLTYRAIVLLNIGAHRNLTRLFSGNNDEERGLSSEDMKIYVIDCRRPVHLANIHAGEQVVVLLDTLKDAPSDGDNLSGNESSTDDEDEDSSDSDTDQGEMEFRDDEDDGDGGENEFGKENEVMDTEQGENATAVADTPTKKSAEDFAQEDDDYDAEDEGEGGRKRGRMTDATEDTDVSMTGNTTQLTAPTPAGEASAMAAMTPRQLHEERRNRLRAYYSSGTIFGSPASFCTYKIATQLRFASESDLLWLACVGVTDAYLHARLDVAGYSQFAIFLRDCCHRLFPNDMYHRVGSAVYAEHLTNGANPAEPPSTRTKISFAGTGRILSETDFRFFLLRHSSLFDGMQYSDYCVSKLGNHNATIPKIRELLAKMGYPLTECQQPFALMKPSLRQRLRDQIREFAPEYGLDNLEFTSFFRVTGYQSLLSASDMTYAVTALLEALDMNGDVAEDEDQRLLESFHRAYEALNSYASAPSSLGLHSVNLTSLVNGAAGGGGLATGLRLAMARQRAILTTAASLVERKAIVRLSHFRYAYVTSSTPHSAEDGDDWQQSNQQDGGSSRTLEDALFAQPLALLRLAHYLMDLHRENGKWTGNRARPLVLVAARSADTYLVVGYEFPESAGTVVANNFGKHFELAAQSMQGNFHFDSFDSNVVEVGAKDAQRFIEQLHYLLDSV